MAIEYNRNVYKILIGKPERKIPVGKHRLRWENNIELNFKETEYEGVNWKY
jgi:hypothetical protein